MVSAAPRSVTVRRPIAVEPRKARPVVWWAGLGAVCVALDVYVLGRYLLDLPDRVPAGPTSVPGFMHWTIKAQEILLPVVLVGVCIKFVVLPLVRRQKIPWDGLTVPAILTLIWQSYFVSMLSYWSTFNADVVNRGSWYEHSPLWLSPNAKGFPEAPLFDLGFFGLWVFLNIWFCFMMRAARRRWPRLGKTGIVTLLVLLGMYFDLTIEFLMMRTGLYHYGGAYRGFGVAFEGHYYQFPLYEMVLFGGLFAGFAGLRYFRNDKGESIVERGVDDLRVGAKGKTWVRFLALTGVFNLMYLIYSVSMALISAHGGYWPEDILKRSYFTSSVCGPRVDMACPGPGVPIPRAGSAYMDQEGNMSHEEHPTTSPPWKGLPPRPVEWVK